jgi:hypothetical protein
MQGSFQGPNRPKPSDHPSFGHSAGRVFQTSVETTGFMRCPSSRVTRGLRPSIVSARLLLKRRHDKHQALQLRIRCTFALRGLGSAWSTA